MSFVNWRQHPAYNHLEYFEKAQFAEEHSGTVEISKVTCEHQPRSELYCK